MSNRLFIFSLSFICILLAVTSLIKNKTRNLEKDIAKLNKDILILEKQLSDSQTDFVYLSSPEKLNEQLLNFEEKKYISFDHTRIFFSLEHFLRGNFKQSNFIK